MSAASRTVSGGDDPQQLHDRAGAFLRSRPAEHSVILTRLARALDGTLETAAGPAPLWWWVEDEGRDGSTVVAVLMQTPPFGAYLSTGPPEAFTLLARRAHAARPSLPGVGGPGHAPFVFADEWRRLSGCGAAVRMRQGLFVARSLVEPPQVPGSHRLARVDDLPVLRPWGSAFSREATPGTPDGLDVDHVTERVRAGLLHVWDVDGTPVSMTAVTPPEEGVSRVQLVYTPPALRGNGFAASCVAAVTRRELAHDGRACMLYTDLANPTSNALYERLGYERIGEAVDLALAPA